MLYSATLSLPKDLPDSDIQKLTAGLDAFALSFTAMRENSHHKGKWLITLYNDAHPDLVALAEHMEAMAEIQNLSPKTGSFDQWIIEEVEDIDWLQRSYEQHAPFDVGPFFIHGSHFDAKAPADKITLDIDAATAFGSGNHGTTAGCLLAMATLKEAGVCPWNVLDMGTGSGILAIAAWKLWKTPVTAVDIEEGAARVATLHCERNQLPLKTGEVLVECGDGFSARCVQSKKPFDLVIANILAGPLKDMADDLKAVCDENGYVILSGILTEQADDVLKAYTEHGLNLKNKMDIEGWSTLTLHNPPL